MTNGIAVLAKMIVLCLCFSMLVCSKVTHQKHLRSEKSIDYYLNMEANSTTERAVRDTFHLWEQATHFKFNYKGRHRAGLKKDGKNTVSFLLKWPSDIPMKNVAYCRSWYSSSGEIIESDIIFNMSVTRFTTLNENWNNSYYIEGVLSHEIGHMIGISHIDMESSVMKNKSSAQESYFKGNIDAQTLIAYKTLYRETTE